MAWEKQSDFFNGTIGLLAGFFLLGVLLWGNPTTRSDPGRLPKQRYFWNGNLIRETIDSNGNHAADIWRYFRKGRPVRLLVDRNNDRKPDAWAEYGEGEEITVFHTDIDFDGWADISQQYRLRGQVPSPEKDHGENAE